MTRHAGAPEVALVADIGGTNARFALTDLASAVPTLRDSHSLKASEYASLEHAIEHYLAQVGVAPKRGALAVASPADRDEIRLTNRAWSFSRGELQRTLGFDALRVINDFGAIAWAVPALTQADRETLHGPTSGALRGPVTIMGPGTGLGVAMLVGDDDTGWRAVDTEGGHVTFAPIGEEEQAISRWLTAQFGRCSNERVLCGAGLAHVDAVLRGATHDNDAQVALRDPADIGAAALAGHDVSARRALARFCAVLGSVCGDAALIHGARTVVIAGGMVPRFIPFLRSSAFRERFLAKGRFVAYLEGVTVHVVTHPHPGLLGAAMALRASYREVGA